MTLSHKLKNLLFIGCLLTPLMTTAQVVPDLDRLVGKNLEDSYLGKAPA